MRYNVQLHCNQCVNSDVTPHVQEGDLTSRAQGHNTHKNTHRKKHCKAVERHTRVYRRTDDVVYGNVEDACNTQQRCAPFVCTWNVHLFASTTLPYIT